MLDNETQYLRAMEALQSLKNNVKKESVSSLTGKWRHFLWLLLFLRELAPI